MTTPDTPFAKIANTINSLIGSNWCWTKNNRCKYVKLMIDMRNGNCLVRDRHNNLIQLKDVQFQIDAPNWSEIYENGECPDCGDDIPPHTVDGEECPNCGHVFYENCERVENTE